MAWDFIQRLKKSVLKKQKGADSFIKPKKADAKRFGKAYSGKQPADSSADAEVKEEIKKIERPQSEFASLNLSSPHISEKASLLSDSGTHTFKVEPYASKSVIKRAVEDRYNVAVDKVRIVNTPSKKRRRGQILGVRPGYKKAMVTLKAGNTIEQY